MHPDLENSLLADKKSAINFVRCDNNGAVVIKDNGLTIRDSKHLSFWPCHMAHGILVPDQGSNPAMEVHSLND